MLPVEIYGTDSCRRSDYNMNYDLEVGSNGRQNLHGQGPYATVLYFQML